MTYTRPEKRTSSSDIGWKLNVENEIYSNKTQAAGLPISMTLVDVDLVCEGLSVENVPILFYDSSNRRVQSTDIL